MIPRPEYPRPQFEREGWMNLNGAWQFEIDHGASGRARGLVDKDPLLGYDYCPLPSGFPVLLRCSPRVIGQV